MYEVYEAEWVGGPFIKAGTIDLVDGKVVFDIKDEGVLKDISCAPPDIIEKGGQDYIDFMIGQRAFSTGYYIEEKKAGKIGLGGLLK